MLIGESPWKRAAKQSGAILAVLLGASVFSPESASQHLYLDVDGDGIRSGADALARPGATEYGVYIVTDKNRDQTRSRLVVSGDGALTINSYELIFRAVGGEVEWLGYANEMPTMYIQLKPYEGGGDYYVGFAGVEALPAGKYRLGTLRARARSGSPSIMFAASSPLRGVLGTSFGSRCSGRDGNNTLKLAASAEALTLAGEGLGDWLDVDGLTLFRGGAQSAASGAASVAKSFRVARVSGEGNATEALSVETPSDGSLVARLFDVRGRLVSVLFDEPSVPAGIYRVPVTDGGKKRYATGVYFYQVMAGSERATGKILVK